MPREAASKELVQDVMSRDVVWIDAGASIHEAIQLMADNRISAIPVVSKTGECVGVISTTDLIDLARNLDEDLESFGESAEGGNWLVGKLLDDFGRRSVTSVMANPPATIRPEASLGAAARTMLRQRVHRLPVVDASGQLIGIISTMDLLAAGANRGTASRAGR